MEWLEEIKLAIDAALEACESVIDKLIEEPRDNWRATLAFDTVCKMQGAIIHGMIDLSKIEDPRLKKPDNVTQWVEELERSRAW